MFYSIHNYSFYFEFPFNLNVITKLDVVYVRY